MEQKTKIILTVTICLIILNLAVYAGTKVGIIPSSGVTAYVDFFVDVEAIDWGTCYVGESVNRYILLTNNGTVPHTLIIFAANWTVSETCYVFTSPQNNTIVPVNQQLNITVSLLPLSCASDYTVFSFNIYLWALG